MSSIPLPALAIQPQQQQNPLGDASKLLALRSMMNQQTLQQQQIQDQQATTQAMKDWDPKTQTYDDLAKMVLKNNGSANAAMGVTQHGLQVQQAVQSLNKDKLDNFIKAHQTVGDTLNGVLNLPDDQLHDGATKAVKSLADAGIMDPQTAATSAQQIQATTDPTALRQQISNVAKVSLGAKAVADQQKTAAETNASNAKAALDQAQTWLDTNKANVIKAYQQNPQQLLSQIDAIAPPNGPNAALNARTKSQVQFALGNGDVDGAKAALKQAAEQVGAVEKDVQVATNPQIQQGKEQVAAVEGKNRQLLQVGNFGQAGDPMVDMVGQNRVDLATALQRVPPAQKESFLSQLSQKYPDFNQGTFGVEKKETTAFTSGTQGQQLGAIETARNHMQTFKQTADALDNDNLLLANKIGNAIGMQFGSDKTTNFQIARSAFAGEVGKAFAGANVGVSDRQDLLDKINSASSPAQLKGYADTADDLLAGKQKSLKDSYDKGMQGKPNFGNGNSNKSPAAAPPTGATHTAMGSDGKKHYTNAQGQDLGVVPQ
jgi:hypothetical protein